MPLTRAAAARNPPVDVGHSNSKPAPKRRQKTTRTKGGTTAASPAGSAVAAGAPTPSIDSTRAVHTQNLTPPHPRRTSITYNARVSNASDINRPVPRLLVHGERDPDPDPDATFISNRMKRGRDDREVDSSLACNSPLNMTMSPSNYVDFSPLWVEDMQNNDSRPPDSRDCGTPLYFPPSPPNANNHETPRSFPPSPANNGGQTTKSPLSSPSGSDYSEKRRDDERRHQQRVRLRGRAAVTPTQEEQDAEDDRTFDQEAPVSPLRFTAAQKGKGKVSTGRPLSDEADASDCVSDQNASEQQLFKSGPVRAAAKAQLIEARRIYHETVAAIAREEEKPVDLLFNIVGENRVKPRRINVWNAFQSWYPEHGEIKREDNMSSTEYNSIICKEYNKKLVELGDEVDDPAARKLHFKVQLDWYESKMQDFVYLKKNDGNFGSVVANIVDDFNHLGQIAWEHYGVHCFGFIIDPSRDSRGRTSSVAWGSGPLYKELRNTYNATLTRQLNDYEGMFKGLEALKAGREYAQERYSVDLRQIRGEGERDRTRRLFGEFLRVDILRIIHEQVDPGDDKKIQMAWARWPDMAFRYQIRLVGWPAEIGKVPGPGFNHKVDMKPKVLAKLVSARIQALSGEDEDDEGILDEGPLCRIEPWTDEEKGLPDEKLMSVPLVLDDSEPANVLMTLMESKKFKQKAGKSKSKLPSRSLNRQLTSESSDDNGTTWPRSRIPRSSNAPQPSTTDGLHIDETRRQHLAPPRTRAPYHPHAATPEASDMDETPRPRPRPRIVQSQALHNSMENRDDWDEEARPAIINTHGAKALTYRRESPQYDRHHPHAVQRDEQRLRNTHLPSQHNQDYHEESHHDNRYTSLQAPLQVQHRRHATDEYHTSDGYVEKQGYYLPQDTLENTRVPYHQPHLPRPETRHAGAGQGHHRQPLPHRLAEPQPSRVNEAHHLKLTRQRERSVEPPPKKRKIHDIDNRTPRQALPMPRRASGNQVAGSSRSRMPLPQSSEAGPSRHREQAFEDHLGHLHDDHNGYDLYNDAGYYK